MANFKRRRPKNRRAGCLLCKPWKANGAKPDPTRRTGRQEWKARQREREQRVEADE
jgi:hypothetical protein